MNRREIIKRLDRLRQTYARYDGAYQKRGVWVNTCVTCGKEVQCDKANGGHFIPRGCLPLRWDYRNVFCQCVHCNLYKSGAYLEYSQWFIKEFGDDVFHQYVDTYRRWKSGKLGTVKIDEIKNRYDYWLAKGWELEEKVGHLFPKTWKPFGPAYIEHD